MKKTNKKQLIRYGLVMVIAFCLAFFFTFTSFDRNVAYANVNQEVETIYVGDVLKANDYKISVEGKSVTAETMTAVFPSGGVYGGDSFQISQAGKYKITYQALVNGETVKEVKEYLAIRRTKDIIIAEEGMNIEYGEYFIDSPYALTKGITGTVVDFKSGQTITFATKVKTAKLSRYYNIIEMIAMPSVFRETDFERLTVKITDSDDANNYVEVIIDSSNTVDGGGQVSYVKAGANGQQAGGYENKTYHTGFYGAQVEHSFRGLGCVNGNRDKHTVSEQILTVAIDNAERKVYCGPASSTTLDNIMINDLDDPTHFKSNPWHGFTSDEVIVSVTAGKFVKGQAKVLFTTIGDYDLTEDILDEKAPEMTFGYDWSEEVPVAKVGQDYPIFPVVSEDALDGELKTNVLVYYVGANGRRVDINHDGEKFFVKYAGTYEIVYSAIDNTGNKKVVTAQVEAVESTPAISISGIEPYIEAEAFQEIIVPLASNMRVVGGSGRLTVEREVTSPSGEVLDVKERLLLTEIGEYQVVYTVTDYLGNTESFPVMIQSLAITAPKFVEEPSFESALIKGFTYSVPSAVAVEAVGDDVEEVPYQVYVNGTLVDSSFVADGKTAVIRYVAEGSTGTAEWERTISVVDTENGKYKSRYFYTEGNIEITDEVDNLKLAISGDSSAEFINALGANSLYAKLRFDEYAMNFNAMKIVLTDAQNKALSVTMNFYYNQETRTWFMQLKDEDRVEYVTSKDIFTLKYVANKGKIVDASGEEVATIKYYDNGDVFQGFSRMVYFAIGFDGVYGNSVMYVEQLCNQVLGYNMSSIDLATDDIKPVIEFAETFEMRQKLGSKAKIPAATSFDVLSQSGDVTVTVLGVDGETLYSGAATGDIDITLNRAGYYLVTYRAKDSNGNIEKLSYGINVNDETAPVLTVDNNLKNEYKVGAKIAIPSYSVTDNDNVWYVQVTLLMPNNELRLLEYNDNGNVTSLLSKDIQVYDNDFKTGDGGFIVQETGRYVLRIVAYDDSYNYVATEIVFYVK